MALPVRLSVLRALVKEISTSGQAGRPLVIGGARELAMVLRPTVCEWLIASFSRKNAILAAAVFVPGVDLPVLTLNQMRLVLRIAAAHGVEISNDRLPELVAVLGGGLGLRALARELVDLVPGVGWAVKASIAYGGTRALGEAAVRYFSARVEADSSRRGRRLRRRRDKAVAA